MSFDTPNGLSNAGPGSRAVGAKMLVVQNSVDRSVAQSGGASAGDLPYVQHGMGVLFDQSKFLEMEQGRLDRTDGDEDDSEDSQEVNAENQGDEAQNPGAAGARTRQDGAPKPAQQQPQQQQPQQQQPQQQPPQQPRDVSVPVGTDEPAPWQRADVRSDTGANPEDSQEIIDKSKRKAAAKKAKADRKKSKSKKSKLKPIETAVEEKKEAISASKDDRPPVAQRSSPEEAILVQLVKELEYGTLLNSINILNQLVSKYPDDPDYRSLLAMAIRLRHGDVWYQYQRKVDVKEEAEPKIPPSNIIKPTANESVNELKKSSWFLIRSVKP